MSNWAECKEHYQQALKAAHKDQRQHSQNGTYPYLQILDEILPDYQTAGEVQTAVKSWLSKLPAETVEYGGKTYFSIHNRLELSQEIPECLFLAGFDQLLLGHEKTESLFLPPEHLRGIFNLAGIVMPAVLLRGRVVGKWKRTGKKLAVTLFEEVSAGDKMLVYSFC